jgi:hypothetical protein
MIEQHGITKSRFGVFAGGKAAHNPKTLFFSTIRQKMEGFSEFLKAWGNQKPAFPRV